MSKQCFLLEFFYVMVETILIFPEKRLSLPWFSSWSFISIKLTSYEVRFVYHHKLVLDHKIRFCNKFITWKCAELILVVFDMYIHDSKFIWPYSCEILISAVQSIDLNATIQIIQIHFAFLMKISKTFLMLIPIPITIPIHHVLGNPNHNPNPNFQILILFTSTVTISTITTIPTCRSLYYYISS